MRLEADNPSTSPTKGDDLWHRKLMEDATMEESREAKAEERARKFIEKQYKKAVYHRCHFCGAEDERALRACSLCRCVDVVQFNILM